VSRRVSRTAALLHFQSRFRHMSCLPDSNGAKYYNPRCFISPRKLGLIYGCVSSRPTHLPRRLGGICDAYCAPLSVLGPL